MAVNEEIIKVSLLGTVQECERLPLAKSLEWVTVWPRVQKLCESGGGRPGLSVLMSLTVSVDVMQH